MWAILFFLLPLIGIAYIGWHISWITDAIYECSWGTHQRGNTHYYTSSGLGIWGGKFRIGTQSEYVVTTLRNEPKKPLSIHHTFLY